MSPDLDKQLCDKYPKIFVNRSKSPQTSCMAFGFEVGDGWYDIIDLLCEALTYTFTTSVEIDEEDGKRLGIEPSVWKRDNEVRYFFPVEPPQVVADQVKEKFGTLRFYYHLEYGDKNMELVKTGKYKDLETVNKRYADYIDGIVHFAEIASGRTCEYTGDKGEMHVRGGWLKILKPEKANELGYKLYKNETQN